MSRVIDLACGVPWLIMEEHLRLILEIADRIPAEGRTGLPAEIEALAAKRGTRMDGAEGSTFTRDGVGIIKVIGPIMRYGNMFSDISGATTLSALAADFNTAMDDPTIHSILFEVDSPGGEANGIGEFAAMVRQRARSSSPRKKVVAYVSGLGASAAYWISSAADEIIANETALLGSIGTVMCHRDTSARDANNGVKNIEIVSSQSPKKRLDPATEKGRAELQKIVDGISDVFIGAVAKHRKVTKAVVEADFGQGGVLMGKDAVKAGMADALGSFESTLAALAANESPSKGATQSAQSNASSSDGDAEEGPIMSWWKGLLGKMTPEEKKELAQELGPAAAGGPSAGPAIPQGLDASALKAAVDAAVSQERAQVAADRQEVSSMIDSLMAERAESFYEKMLSANRVLPKDKESVVADFIAFAKDDSLHPVKTGEKTRLDRFKATIESRPRHTLTTEGAGAGLPDNAEVYVLNSDTGESLKLAGTDMPQPDAKVPLAKGLSEARRRELLAMTNDGMAKLQEDEEKKNGARR